MMSLPHGNIKYLVHTNIVKALTYLHLTTFPCQRHFQFFQVWKWEVRCPESNSTLTSGKLVLTRQPSEAAHLYLHCSLDQLCYLSHGKYWAKQDQEKRRLGRYWYCESGMSHLEVNMWRGRGVDILRMMSTKERRLQTVGFFPYNLYYSKVYNIKIWHVYNPLLLPQSGHENMLSQMFYWALHNHSSSTSSFYKPPTFLLLKISLHFQDLT